MSDQRLARPSRVHLPNLVAGLVVGLLVAGGLVPLVGSDRATSGAAGTPGFLDQSVPGATTPGGGTAIGGPAIPGAPGSAGSGPGAASVGGGSPADATGGVGGVGGSADGTGAVTRVASDIGVTPDTIRIGTMTLDCQACGALGVEFSGIPQSEIVAAFVDDINRRGGINGRQLESFTANYDPAQDALTGGGTERAACLRLTEEHSVFAVVGGATFANSCVYGDHETPLIHKGDVQAEDPDTFNASQGRLWLTQSSSGRTLSNWAQQLVANGFLSQDQPFGIVHQEGYEQTMVDRYLIPELERLGFSPTRVAVIPNNFALQPSRISTEVPAMRAAGVGAVLLATNFSASNSWIKEAQRNGWKPQYLVSDFPTAANDLIGGNMSADVDFDGAIAISWVPDGGREGLLANPESARCLGIWEQAHGAPTHHLDHPFLLEYCSYFTVFELAMTRAGPNPTRESLLQSLASLGSFPNGAVLGGRGSFGGPYAFGPVKWSAADQFDVRVWRSDCPRPADQDGQCYVQTGAPQPMAA